MLQSRTNSSGESWIHVKFTNQTIMTIPEDKTIKFMWLSFRDPEENEFLGGCIVPVDESLTNRNAIIEDAIKTAWTASCNPGGEVLSVGMTQAQFDHMESDGFEVGRLYTKDELDPEKFSTL